MWHLAGRKEIRDGKKEQATIKTAAVHRQLERESTLLPTLLKFLGVLVALFIAFVLIAFRNA